MPGSNQNRYFLGSLRVGEQEGRERGDGEGKGWGGFQVPLKTKYVRIKEIYQYIRYTNYKN